MSRPVSRSIFDYPSKMLEPKWQPADSRKKTALEKRLGSYRVEKIVDNSQAEADAKSFLRRKSDGGSKVTDVVEGKTNAIGDPGHHIDKKLMANKYLKKFDRKFDGRKTISNKK